MKFVELFGSTSSGKSFLLSKLKLSLSMRFSLVYTVQDVYNYFLFNSRYSLLNFSFSFLPNNFKSFFSYLFFVRFGYINKYKKSFYNENKNFVISFQNCLSSVNHTKEHRKNCVKWFNSVVSIYQFCKLKMPKSSIILFDEGFTQKLFNTLVTYDSSTVYDLVSPYMDSLPEVYPIIYVESTIDRCVSRSDSLHLPFRIKNLKPEEIKKFISNSIELSSFIYNNSSKLPMKKIKNY